jgi:hypothetical protein
VTRWFRLGLSVAGSFVCRCLTSLAMLRFHTPLIKPGRRFSRTRLSDKALLHILLHTFAHEQSTLRSWKSVHSQLLVQMLVGESCCSLAPYLELHAQPLTHPMAEVAVDDPVGLAHRSKAKVVGPTR